jgi:hypothetical protein
MKIGLNPIGLSDQAFLKTVQDYLYLLDIRPEHFSSPMRYGVMESFKYRNTSSKIGFMTKEALKLIGMDVCGLTPNQLINIKKDKKLKGLLEIHHIYECKELIEDIMNDQTRENLEKLLLKFCSPKNLLYCTKVEHHRIHNGLPFQELI